MKIIEAALFSNHPVKSVCQLEGSDHGGRDSAAELALAGTKDVQVSGSLIFAVSPTQRFRIIHLQN